MNYTQKYFLNLIKCFYLNKECTPPEDELDMRELYNLAEMHGVQGIIFSKIKDFSSLTNSEYYHRLRMDFFSLTMGSVIIEENLKILTNLLNDNGCKHILFKGSVVKNFYPSKELRTMGDIDILVDVKNYEKIHNLLLKNNFEYDEQTSEKLTQAYDYNNTHFEVHTSLANKNSYIHSGDFLSFFSDAFDHAVNIENLTYSLEPAYHLAFLLYHLERHFERNGFGIRMLLDFPFFYDKNQVDIGLLKKYLAQINLTDFASCIFNLCNNIFDSDLPIIGEKQLDSNLSEFLLNKVLAKGTFGISGGDDDSRKILWVQLKYGYNPATTSGKIKSFLRWLFPTKQDLCDLCLCTEETPTIKMPAVYFGRIIDAIKKRTGPKGKKYKTYNHSKISNNDFLYINLLKELGIKK
ncbi:MAG: nucleotidyltransferase family protein [Oscillospiraceae bacterium]|nr:nucleotidyltransferase family protein [Oscillospiraceae bacterium]